MILIYVLILEIVTIPMLSNLTIFWMIKFHLSLDLLPLSSRVIRERTSFLICIIDTY